jgi:integrase
MTDSNVHRGTQIAVDVRGSSERSANSIAPLKTLDDLLKSLAENPNGAFPMLRTTCSLLAAYIGKPITEITIASVNDSRKDFRGFLESRKYTEASIRSYVNYLRILINQAGVLGWSAGNSVPEIWQKVLNLARAEKCEELAIHLSHIRKRPQDVLSADVDAWVQKVIREDRTYRSATLEKGHFWRLLRAQGCTEQLPLCLLREKGYGVPVADFPAGLKKEVLELLRWKRAEFAMDRPTNARIRAVTSRGLKDMICQLYGFAVDICGEADITSLPQLVQKQIVWRFVDWKINERKVKAQGVKLQISRLSAAMRQHPNYRALDHSWLKILLDGLPIEHESELKRRKAAKYVEYKVLESIAEQINAERSKAQKKGPWRLALHVRNELLMRWLPILPWRQRNVRECRISGPDPNLFRQKISPFSDVDKPEWLMQAESKNPEEEFWQFHFNPDETKTGIDVQAVLPRSLISLLEEYLRDHRANLLKGPDPGTLFLNEKGRPMTEDQITVLVGDLTQMYGGKRVTPHPFRDVVAFTWLKAHPKDYLTLSKILWHADVNTTIRMYGSRFNESCGVTAMDSWLEEREKKGK